MVTESLVLTYKLNLIVSMWVSRRNTVDRTSYCLWFQGPLHYEDMFPTKKKGQLCSILSTSLLHPQTVTQLRMTCHQLGNSVTHKLPWTLLSHETFSLTPLIHLKSESELVSIHERKIPKYMCVKNLKS